MIYKPHKDVAFYDAVTELKQILAKDKGSYRMMDFKGILVTVSVDSNPDDIATIYDLKKRIIQIESFIDNDAENE